MSWGKKETCAKHKIDRSQNGRSNEPRSLSLFGWLLNKKAVRVEVNIQMAFLNWVGIALLFVSDIAIFELKRDVKL